MTGKVIFGLIGVGGISQSQHLPNLTRAGNIHLKTICDLNVDVLEDMQKKYDVPEALTDYKQLLGDPEIEAVVIATKPDSHIGLAIESLNAGKHVYVEKPLAESPDDCKLAKEAQKASGKILAVGFNRRMAPVYRKVKEIFDANAGPKNIHYRISDAYHQWGAGNPPGMRIIHEVCHIFDILRYLCDSEVTSVYCVKSRPDDECIVLTFESGCVASIMSSGYVWYDMPKESLEAVLDLGALIATDFVELQTFGLDNTAPLTRFAGHTHPDHDTMHGYLFESGGADVMLNVRREFSKKFRQLEMLREEASNSIECKNLEREFDEHFPLVNYMMDKGWQHAHEHFAESILTNKPCQLADATDGLKAAMITRAAIESRNTGRVVEL